MIADQQEYHAGFQEVGGLIELEEAITDNSSTG